MLGEMEKKTFFEMPFEGWQVAKVAEHLPYKHKA
jgi:hypothetical protein